MGMIVMKTPFAIDSLSLHASLFGPTSPLVLDVARPEIVREAGWLIPGARSARSEDASTLAESLDRGRVVVVACAHGHNRSQQVVAELRRAGIAAATLEGGRDAWAAAGLPRVRREADGIALGGAPTVWVTRRRPKIDRIACPWLVARFLDPDARFLFVDPDQVLAVAADAGGIPYDLPGGLFEHAGERCSFDALLEAFGLDGDPRLAELALIVRGADTGRLDLAPACAGLLGLSLGLSARHGDDDHALLRDGFLLYDALYTWLLQARSETHLWVRQAA
jgi:rhodanese-related sulfurtransferase